MIETIDAAPLLIIVLLLSRENLLESVKHRQVMGPGSDTRGKEVLRL